MGEQGLQDAQGSNGRSVGEGQTPLIHQMDLRGCFFPCGFGRTGQRPGGQRLLFFLLPKVL